MIQLDQKLINSKGQELAQRMTLRDHFAGLAMQSILSRVDYNILSQLNDLAVDSYNIADAMLAEREK